MYPIGFGILIFLLIVMIVQLLKFTSLQSHIVFTFANTGLQLYTDPSEIPFGQLSSNDGVVTNLDQDTVNYLLHLMSVFYKHLRTRDPVPPQDGDTFWIKDIIAPTSKRPLVQVYDNTSDDSMVLLFRGTLSKKEWKYDLKTNFTDPNFVAPHEIQLHEGYLQIYQYISSELWSTYKQLNRRHIYIVSHSLGNLASIFVLDLLYNSNIMGRDIFMLSLGSPRIGNHRFCQSIEDAGVQIFNIMNRDDIVTQLPLTTMPSISGEKRIFKYRHMGNKSYFEYKGQNCLDNHSLATYQKFLKQVDPSPV
jgi:hypothetical protein